MEDEKKLNHFLSAYFDGPRDGGLSEYLLLSKISRKLLPDWYLPMLKDKNRNTFYQTMLKNKVSNKIVIDLGSGTGMWAIESLANGASFVYLVEKNPALVKYLEIVFKDKPVKIISKLFKDLEKEDFDQGTPEILVHEVFSSTGIGEGIIPAFEKMNALFPNGALELLPRYLWIEARVRRDSPMKLSEHEGEFLDGNEDILFELLHPLQLKKKVKEPFSDITGPAHQLLFLDLSTITDSSHYELAPVPIDLIPGMVHKVDLSFKFSYEFKGPFFDTAIDEGHHWGGMLVEFYISKKALPSKKLLSLHLTDKMNIGDPLLKETGRTYESN
jgi:hypothetical protein